LFLKSLLLVKTLEIIWYLIAASLCIYTGLKVILALRNASVKDPLDGACLELYLLIGL
mgnify:CR=1